MQKTQTTQITHEILIHPVDLAILHEVTGEKPVIPQNENGFYIVTSEQKVLFDLINFIREDERDYTLTSLIDWLQGIQITGVKEFNIQSLIDYATSQIAPID